MVVLVLVIVVCFWVWSVLLWKIGVVRLEKMLKVWKVLEKRSFELVVVWFSVVLSVMLG